MEKSGSETPKKKSEPLEQPATDGSTIAPDPNAALAVTTQAAVDTTSMMTDLVVTPMEAVGTDAVPPDISQQTIPSKAYGDFVREVGLAVAEAQKSLDENSVSSALKLAETEIPALIALNQVVNEDGEIESVTPVVQKDAKLIQYIQPTFYQWSRVTMFARFDIKDFKANAATEIQSTVRTSSSSSRLGGSFGFSSLFSGGLSGGFNQGSSSVSSDTSTESAVDVATAQGTSFMLAELRPRTDTRFPAAIIAVQGPQLSASATATSLPAPTDPAVPSQLSVSLTLFKKDGFKETGGKTVDVRLDGSGELSASSVALSPVVGDAKRLTGSVTLRRRTGDTPGTSTVRASIGTLNSSLAVNFP